VAVGGKRHVQVMNLLANLSSEEEEDLLRSVLGGWTQQDIAQEFGMSQTTVHRRIRQLLKHAV